MTVHAKEIINGKFWILEEKGKKIATVSLTDQKYLLTNKQGVTFLTDRLSIEKNLGDTIEWSKLQITEIQTKEIYDFPTNTIPHHSMYNLQNKLPLFTKSEKSKSFYCAGYYIIKFDKGSVKSFCPKLITLEKYMYEGPFKTKIELNQALSRKK